MLITPQQQESLNDILIVDDTPDNLRLLDNILSDRGYEVRKAINGDIALKAIKIKKPALILLDINMPGMNGYQVCEKLKAAEKTKDIPIIFLSVLEELGDKVQAFKVGGVDYITKPFQVEEVMARIESQLTIQKQKLQLKQEIKERKQAEMFLYQSRSLLSSILNCSLDGIAALQAIRNPRTGKIEDFECVVVNPVITQVFGKETEDLMGKRLIKKLLRKLDPTLFAKFVQVIETEETLEEDFYYKSGKIKAWYHYIAVKFHDGFTISIHNITDRKRMELKLKRQLYLDDLTQVANVRFFDESLQKKWQLATRSKQPLSLIMCDVDDFNIYNAYNGHPSGDNCLKKIAKTLIVVVKRPGYVVARYGGEEFAILLPNTDVDAALTSAKKIQEEIQELKIPYNPANMDKHITLSLGVATIIPTQEMLPESLITAAKKSLLEAKKRH